eukprot:gene2260-1654_t
MPAKAAAPATKKAGAKSKKVRASNPLFVARPRSARIGGDVRPKGRDLSRFVRWPKYVRLQRQKKILLQRLKMPPSIHQFSRTLDKNQAAELFKLLIKKMDVPFAIVKGKARLGTLTHLKTSSVVALTKVNKDDEAKLKQLTESFHAQFNENVERKWRDGTMGLKTQAKLEKRRQQLEVERLKKLEAQR